MTRIDPPGFLDDFSDAQKDQWSQKVSKWLDTAQQAIPRRMTASPSVLQPLKTPPAADQSVAIISWNAFPVRSSARRSARSSGGAGRRGSERPGRVL